MRWLIPYIILPGAILTSVSTVKAHSACIDASTVHLLQMRQHVQTGMFARHALHDGHKQDAKPA